MRRLIVPLLLGGTALAVLTMQLTGLPSGIFLLHGTLMLVAWGVLLPFGGVLARYHKVTDGQRFPDEVDNPFWWNWHRGLAILGIILALIALAAVLRGTGGQVGTLHGWCGLATMVLGCLQTLSPLLRGSKGGPTDPNADPGDPSTWRGDHFDMSDLRRAFERWHKTVGWLSLACATFTIFLGLDLVGAPEAAVATAGALAGAAFCAVLDGTLRARWVDTYAALWAAGPCHPDPDRRLIAPDGKSASGSSSAPTDSDQPLRPTLQRPGRRRS